MAQQTIVNVGYRSTNDWVISAGTSRILVDIGWPGTLGMLKANLKKMGFHQVHAIPLMKAWTKPVDKYVEITMAGNIVVPCQESRALLARIGIAGEILPTPGHSDHCVSLLLDDGSVFTGDLSPEAAAFDNPTALASWQFLRDRGARRVHPAHGPIRSIGPRRETVQ
ncbi:MAG TPA: hypothetical protein VFI56_00305 [Vicinamibacterales bacterium]|nr:hypothetical protein [Vicinamibacterales bacterium]